MKTLDRYLALIFSKNLALGVLAMTALFLFQSMFTDLYDQHYAIRQILFYHWMNVPKTMVEMAPAATMMATVLTLAGLSRTNELVACFSIGYGLRRMMGLILLLVLIESCAILFMEDRVLPPLFRVRTTYHYKVMLQQPDFFLDVKRDKVWYRSKNMIYNLQRFDNQAKTIFGMSIYSFDDQFNLLQVIGAERAEFSPKGWKLYNGTVTVFSPDDPFPLAKEFTEKEVFISETPKDFQEIEKEVDGLRFRDLRSYIKKLKNSGADTKALEVKLQSRISLCFVPIVMCLLAVPFSVGNRRSGGVARDLGICLLMTLFYWLFYSTGLSLGSKGALPPWLAAWLPSIVFGTLGAVFITRRQ
ncbi:MAG: LPS export ABC transporter permease LptG [Bdellovibrio sp.]|nr:LPS export ABC transporter permease LptG [Bdellovibrio sp.]